MKRIIKLFEENSAIKGSVGNMSIYVVPLYSFSLKKVYVLLAGLVIERDSSGYVVKINFLEYDNYVDDRKKAEKFIESNYGRFLKLLERALAIKHPNATRIAELFGCYVSDIMIGFLHEIYGDDILNDNETLSGLRSICYDETRFFINDKVIVVLDISLQVVRDVRGNKVFVYRYDIKDFHEVSPKTKVFYDALFKGFRDLLKPEAVVEGELGYRYAFSSTEVEVDGKKISLMMIDEYNPYLNEWHIYDILAITCDNRCLVYSFGMGDYRGSLFLAGYTVLEKLMNYFLGYILSSGKFQKRAKDEAMGTLIKRNEWEILPA
ncbi:MAG: hypothetical protein C0179_05835 [Fervidicoccus sp.]|nr:MAG: hypothetical protein C0179_05835 [Fervidicoccus sp.]